MKAVHIATILILVAMIAGCQPQGQSTEADQSMAVPVIEEEFEPEIGMPLSQLVAMPGVTWQFERQRGICAPDTMVLWVNYNGKDYLTNVRGVNNEFPLLTNSGLKRVLQGNNRPDFMRIDFSPHAALSYAADMTKEEYLALCDTIYVSSIRELKETVKDFYQSKGMAKYMASTLAANWRVILSQSQAEGAEAPNPFNHQQYIEFEPGTINVELPNPSTGIVEVSAYCLDNYTLGYPGWAYWTVVMCKENGKYRVKEMPAQHRKFVTG